jgi:hypothetical protein
LTALADAGVALPTGWLWEDGGTYSRTTYANLFAAVTTAHSYQSIGRPLHAQQVRQLGEVHRDAADLVLGEPLVDRAALRLVIKIEITERLAGGFVDREAFAMLLYRPWR